MAGGAGQCKKVVRELIQERTKDAKSNRGDHHVAGWLYRRAGDQ